MNHFQSLAWLLLLAGTSAGCTDGPATPRPVGAAGDADWFWLNATASPDGSLSVFQWVPPNGSSLATNERGTRGLHLEGMLLGDDVAGVVEWGVWIFDRFEDGPHQGQWRPQLYRAFPLAEHAEGFPQGRAVPAPANSNEFRDELSNVSGFDGRPLSILVAARAASARSVSLGLSVIHGVDYFGFEGEHATLRPDLVPTPMRRVEPSRSAQGFAFAWFEESVRATSFHEAHSSNVRVERRSGLGSPDSLHVQTGYGSPAGWTFATSAFSGFTRIGDYHLEADYRGRGLRAQGPIAEADGRQVAASYGLNHYVYRDGPGPSSFDLQLDVTGRSGGTLTFFKFDTAVPLGELLDGPTMDLWKVR
jgi:hypothetical protein